MGCQADKEHLPSFHVLLTRTSLKSIDDFYEEVERTIAKIQSLSESVEIVIDKFASATGIYGPPNRSVAFGLLGLVVALLASARNDTMTMNLHFSDYAPGIILQETGMDSSLIIAYHSWVELIEFLEAATEHLQHACPRMAEYLTGACGLLGKIQGLPEASELRPIDYRKLEKTVNGNFDAIKLSIEQLHRLLVKVTTTLQEAVLTLNELSRLTDLSQLLQLSHRAGKRGILTVPDVIREFGFELDQVVKEHRKVMVGGYRELG
jgi:hypothetical protein